jgi:hypothetical protein
VLSANEQDAEDYKPRAGETRKRARRTARDEEDSGSEHDAPRATPVVRKKVKKAGKLSRLQEMPMEILTEVSASPMACIVKSSRPSYRSLLHSILSIFYGYRVSRRLFTGF